MECAKYCLLQSYSAIFYAVIDCDSLRNKKAYSLQSEHSPAKRV